MKNLLFILMLLVCLSCEEVVNVDLNKAAPRLVIDASINWEKGTSGKVQTIKLSTTAGYYDTVIPKISGATIFVTNSSGVVFNFTEQAGTDFVASKYICNNFAPILGENYTLTVIHNNQTYSAQEKLIATPPIRDVDQRNDLGLNSDEIGVRINFIDTPNEPNFYLFRFGTSVNAFPEYQIIDDQFTEGNVTSWLYSNKNLKKDSEMNFILYGISESYHTYMKIVLANSSGSGAFGPSPTRVKGNIINVTNRDNYALGYFRLSETNSYNYVIQ